MTLLYYIRYKIGFLISYIIIMLYKYILGLIIAILICYFIFFKNIIITEKLENFNGNVNIVGHNKEDYNII